MIDISVNELVKSFEVGQTLLDGLSFDIHEGECVGIMGRNGCGKTTLFRLLTGELSPDSGEIHIAAREKAGPHLPDPGLSGRIFRRGCTAHGLRRADLAEAPGGGTGKNARKGCFPSESERI